MTPEEFIDYERDVTEAHEAYPDLEMGEAYHKFMKEIKKQPPRPMLRTNDTSLKVAKSVIIKAFKRPCTQAGCPGQQVLSGVCGGCAAAKKGFKSVWECEECLYREFSKKPYLDWYEELSKEKDNGL